LQTEKYMRNYIGPKSLKVNFKNKEKIEKLLNKKTLPALKKELQTVFNTFIRLRDTQESQGKKFFVCISCGHPKELNQMNAGHYWAAGGHEAVRFDEDNVHGQCIHCNLYQHSNEKLYRVNLIKKIGQKAFDILEMRAHNKSKMFPFEVELLISEYKNKIESLKK
jgi:hypothetical protein